MMKWTSKFKDGVYTPEMSDPRLDKYELTYGAGNALESFYYRILYALSTRGIKKVRKIFDYYNISPKTQEFGFSSRNLREEMTSASQLLGQVGQVIKSIVAMKKDKQRIQECLDYYKKKKTPDDITLKGVWADMVDPKSGAASFVNAAKNLDLYVARDWFFKIKNRKELDLIPEGKIPGVVRGFLARKFTEYEIWKGNWKQSLMHFKKILDQQYKASEKTVELYRNWIQPLIYNVESLKMKPELGLSPYLLKISSNLVSQVKLVAWMEHSYEEPKDLKKAREEYAKRMTDRERKKSKKEFIPDYVPFGRAYIKDEKGRKVEVPYVPVIEVDLKLVGPSNTQFMTTIVEFEIKIYTIEEFENRLFDKWTKDPAEEWIKNLMLREGLNLDDEEEKSEDKVELIPGQDFFRLLFGKLRLRKAKPGVKKKLSDHMILYHLNNTSIKKMNKELWLVYYILKKSFGMYTFLKVF